MKTAMIITTMLWMTGALAIEQADVQPSESTNAGVSSLIQSQERPSDCCPIVSCGSCERPKAVHRHRLQWQDFGQLRSGLWELAIIIKSQLALHLLGQRRDFDRGKKNVVSWKRS